MSDAPEVTQRLARNRGLALITVLWLISLLTLLATAMLAITRSHARIAARTAQSVATEAVEDSAIRLTLLQINAPLREGQQLGFSAGWQLKLFDRTIDIRLEREAGRVDLNASDTSLLAAVFIAGGTDAGAAHSFASRIVDWRDANAQPEPDGAELEEYQRAHLGYGPRNRPFEAVGELRQVLGLAELSPELLDAFTVYSTRSPLIEIDFAHPLVRGALERLASSRRAQSGGESATTPPASLGAGTLIGQAARIHACTAKDGLTLCRAAVVRLTGKRQKPFLVYAWYTE